MELVTVPLRQDLKVDYAQLFSDAALGEIAHDFGQDYDCIGRFLAVMTLISLTTLLLPRIVRIVGS